MRESNSFTLCVSPHLDGGGVTTSRWGGVLPSQAGGYYLQVGGILPSQVGGTTSRWGGGTT